MKTTLNQSLILKLKIEQKPIGIEGKRIVFEPNPALAPYIVFDDHQDAPVGFGVKVAGKKTYVIQRKIHGKVVKAKIGNVSDYTSIGDARTAAQLKATQINATGKNPNTTARETAANEKTLGGCWTKYLEYLQGRAEPAKPNTIKTFNKAHRKLQDWDDTKVIDLSSDQIISRFDEIKGKTPTTAEQTFRWANVCVEFAIEKENFEARKQRRESLLDVNPFKILRMEERYRTRKQLEASKSARGLRKPLSVREGSLGALLNAVWSRRKENRTGCDFLLCCLLLGARKSEPAELRWRDSLTDAEAHLNSWADMETRKIFFFDTKGRTNLLLPMSAGVYEILRQRQGRRADGQPSQQKWVFPARSPFSKTGHYSNMNSLLKYICEDAKITRRAPHDFRRTFASIAEELTSYAMVKRLLGHADRSDPTEGYAQAEWERTKEVLQRIELHILATAPTVYNALLTPTYPLLEDEHAR